MKRFQQLSILMIVLASILAACSPAGMSAEPQMVESDSGGGFADFAEESAPMAPAAERAFDDSVTNSTGDGGATVERLVIKNADLSISVDEPLTKMNQVMSMAEEMGGFVVSSNLYYRTLDNGAEVPVGDVSIRIPSTRFDEALTTIKAGVGQVLHENVSGQDVTQEYTDLQSRLNNLIETEAGLQRIMDEATKTEDVLQVYNQLTYIREQIEVIKGRMQYFEQSASFSLISVNIQADEAVQPLSIGGWQPVGVAKDAIQALINTFKVIANAVIWLVIYVLPLLVLLYILFLIGRGVYRAAARPKARKAPEENGE